MLPPATLLRVMEPLLVPQEAGNTLAVPNKLDGSLLTVTESVNTMSFKGLLQSL